MGMAEPHGPANLQGVGNFYRAMFFVSLILLILLPLTILGVDLFLGAKELGYDGELTALDEELKSLSEAMVADSNAVAALEAEVMGIARSEQIFATDSDPRSVWRPDSRWSEMGREHILELWDRQDALRSQATLSRALLREKTAERAHLLAGKDQVLFVRTWIREHAYLFYGALVAGGFATLLFALLWGALVQTRANGLLARWASR